MATQAESALSCVETGRSKPSAAVVLELAERFDVPLRDRSTLLLAAGHTPRYEEHVVGSPALEHVRAMLQRLLDTHQPYPGVVLNRHWNILLANATAQALLQPLPHALTARQNIFRIGLHPEVPRTVHSEFRRVGRRSAGQAATPGRDSSRA